MNGVTLWSKTISIEHEIPSNQLVLMHQSPNHINSALKFSTLNSPFLGRLLTIQTQEATERGEGDAEIEVHKPTRHPKETI